MLSQFETCQNIYKRKATEAGNFRTCGFLHPVRKKLRISGGEIFFCTPPILTDKILKGA